MRRMSQAQEWKVRSDRGGAVVPPRGGGRIPSGNRRLVPPVQTRAPFSAPFRDVKWSVAYAALLLYIITIVTYRIPYGQPIMLVSLFGLVAERKIRIPAFMVAFGALFGLAILSALGSAWPELVREQSLELGKLWLIAFVAVSTLSDRRRVRLFMLVFLAAYALYPVRGALVNYFLGGYTIFGRAVWNYIYANPNDLAALTLLQLSVAAAFYAAEPPGWWRRAALAGLVVLPVLILLTQSRGAFVGLVLFGITAGVAHRRRFQLAGFAAILLLVASLVIPSSAWDRLGMVGTLGSAGTEALAELDDQGSAEQRYQIWQTSFRIIRDHPLQGVGWGAYPQANLRYNPELGARDTHSTYLNLAAEIGLPGLIIFLVTVGLTVGHAERVRRRIKATDPVSAQQIRLLLLGLGAFLVAGLFASYSALTFLYIHLVLIWVVADLNGSRRQPPRASPRLHKRIPVD